MSFFFRNFVVQKPCKARNGAMTMDNKEQKLVFYNTDDGNVKVDVVMDAERETMWATQKSIAQVFGVTVPNISYHLKNIFDSGELMRDMVIKEFLITAQSGARGLS